MTPSPSSSSPTTSRPTASARSPRCTSGVPIELALFGGRSHHATAGVEDPGVPHRRVEQREVRALAATRRATARSSAGTAGRVALPAAWLGARRARVAVRPVDARCGRTRARRRTSPARPLLRAHLPRRRRGRRLRPARRGAYARARGARGVARRAAGRRQRVLAAPRRRARTARRPFTALFVGRDVPGEGARVLLAAWRASALELRRRSSSSARIRVRSEPGRRRGDAGRRAPEEVRNFLRRRATFWSYRRSPRAASASRGGSSPTRP